MRVHARKLMAHPERQSRRPCDRRAMRLGRRLGSFVLGLITGLVGVEARADDPAKPASVRPTFTVPGVEPRAADADAPLVEGWPKATRPGVVEVKDYPAYRGAVARGKNTTMESDSVLFFPLFVHIQTRNIEMSSPVVNTFDSAMIEKPGATGDVAMELVYRTPDVGPAGQGVGAVLVEDHPASRFVCLGVQGEMNPDRFRLAVAALKSWLEDHKEDWTAEGAARRIGYHSPMTDSKTRLWEVQIPIKPSLKPR